MVMSRQVVPSEETVDSRGEEMCLTPGRGVRAVRACRELFLVLLLYNSVCLTGIQSILNTDCYLGKNYLEILRYSQT